MPSCGWLRQQGRSGLAAQVLQMAAVAASGKRLPESEGPDFTFERLHVIGQVIFTPSTHALLHAALAVRLAESHRPKPFACLHVGTKPASHGARDGAKVGSRAFGVGVASRKSEGAGAAKAATARAANVYMAATASARDNICFEAGVQKGAAPLPGAPPLACTCSNPEHCAALHALHECTLSCTKVVVIIVLSIARLSTER